MVLIREASRSTGPRQVVEMRRASRLSAGNKSLPSKNSGQILRPDSVDKTLASTKHDLRVPIETSACMHACEIMSAQDGRRADVTHPQVHKIGEREPASAKRLPACQMQFRARTDPLRLHFLAARCFLEICL